MDTQQDGTFGGDILIVDDTPENLRLLSVMLSKQGFHIRKALSGQAALTAAHAVIPDLILLDIMMPEMDGYTVCQHLKAQPDTADIPIIFLSALHETFDKVKAFQVGGVDYITKPFHLEEVLSRVQSQLTLRAWAREIRQLNLRLEERVKERTQALELANQELLREVAERQRVQAQLLDMAFHDSLTGLPNRALFMERLVEELHHIHQNPQYQFSVLFLDCDRFKVINDSMGHLAGDELLIAIARRLESCLSDEATLARLGGDEFAILLPQLSTPDRAVQTAKKILEELHCPFQLQRGDIFISASIGIVLGTPSYNQPEHLLRDADTAMYRAKAVGRACYQIFDFEMHEAALHVLHLETELRQAIERQEFVLHYQPIVSLRSGKISGFEALVRWQHPKRGLISPASFIPLAEETGLINPIGEWVLRTACHQLQNWQQRGLVTDQFFMSINLSVRQFSSSQLIPQVDQILAESCVNPWNLKLEITESVTIENVVAKDILQQLKERHICLSIDDFGTGYSSLRYLNTLPVDSLKIDRSFICRLTEDPEDAGLIPAIISMTQALKMKVIAEGVETIQQLNQLRDLNCDFGQGYLFSRPLDMDKATELFIADPCW